jgi:hypothetical protein
MEKWYYPAYLPKPPHHMNEYEWQTYKTGLTKREMSDRYSGITSDLIPAFEMIEAQGLGGRNPGPKKWETPYEQAVPAPKEDDRFGPSEAYTNMFDEDNPAWATNNFAQQTSGFDPVNAAWQDSMSGGQQQYGLASDIIDLGERAYDGIQRAGEIFDNAFGTKEDPTAYRLGVEWLTGTGPKERYLGPETRFVREFRNSAGIGLAREKLYSTFHGRPKNGDSIIGFPVEFTIPYAWNARTAAEHFVGTYIVDLRVTGGTIQFEARNTTSLESLTGGRWRSKIGLWPDWPNRESGPGSNKYQVMTWTEPLR